MTPRVILFDFDGTLADSFDAITASVNHVRQRYGFATLSADEVKPLVGWGLSNLLETIAPGVAVESAIQEYRNHHETVIESDTRLFPGVVETLTRLRSESIRMGVCSNKAVHFTRELLAMFHIREFFEVVMGPEDVGGRAKPIPDMVTTALQRLNASTSDTLYIGDMVIDVQTARAAGVPVWVIPSGPHSIEVLRESKPDRLLDAFTDILPALGMTGT